MEAELQELERRALAEAEAVQDLSGLESFRITYLGKKGLINGLMKKLKDLPQDERAKAGQLANQTKSRISELFEQNRKRIEDKKAVKRTLLDVTLPGREPARGHLHPINQVQREICEIFVSMGYQVVEGPNVELDYYNFEALNIPKDHPARDMQDTFYVTDNVVLRTHTSPMEVRVMEKQRPPVNIIAPGKVYRRDSDVSHTPMFHQVEGLVVDKGITFGDLKGTLTAFVHRMFGKDTAMRFRPSFFPFTEPSAEIDIGCVICRGKGCRVCKQTGWLEILGAGMIDPEVFKQVGYDPEEYSGFAFGLGVERIAMLKYGINDIRLYYENDLRFLAQF